LVEDIPPIGWVAVEPEMEYFKCEEAALLFFPPPQNKLVLDINHRNRRQNRIQYIPGDSNIQREQS
jgi:hypothetical protein